MSGQAIALATKGMICCPKSITRNFVIPVNLSIKTNQQTINILRDESFKINLSACKEKINIVNEGIGLTILTKKPSINLKACN